MTFETFRNLFHENFKAVTNDRVLFETDADKDRLWDIYLNSFPDGTNPRRQGSRPERPGRALH